MKARFMGLPVLLGLLVARRCAAANPPGQQLEKQLLDNQRVMLKHLYALSIIDAEVWGTRSSSEDDSGLGFSARVKESSEHEPSLENAVANQRLVLEGMLLYAKIFSQMILRVNLDAADNLSAATTQFMDTLLAEKEKKEERNAKKAAAAKAAEEASAMEAGRVAALREADANLSLSERLVAARQKLYEAALFGRTATVEELLLAPSYDGGADPDYCTSTGQTSSYAAALRGNINELRLLVSAGADLSLAAEDGVNPCLAAVQVASTYKNDKETLDVISLLAEHKACDSADKEDGATPAWAAAFNGRLDIIQTLAKHGARLNVADTRNKITPLEAAKSRYRDDVADFLQQKHQEL